MIVMTEQQVLILHMLIGFGIGYLGLKRRWPMTKTLAISFVFGGLAMVLEKMIGLVQ